MQIDIVHDVTGNDQIVAGSDRRLNTSSRSAPRSYYNSKDAKQAYSLVWQDASSETGDIILYWKNTDTQGRHLVIGSIGLNSEEDAIFELMTVTGVASGGATTAPSCLNRAAPEVANATSLTAITTPITGLTDGVIIDIAGVQANGHEEFRLDDRLRIGQGGAIAIKMVSTPVTPTKTWGVVFGYYEI